MTTMDIVQSQTEAAMKRFGTLLKRFETLGPQLAAADAAMASSRKVTPSTLAATGDLADLMRQLSDGAGRLATLLSLTVAIAEDMS